MAAIKPVIANTKYGARKLRSRGNGLPRNSSTPGTLHPSPATTPKTLRNRTYDIDEAIPIFLSVDENVFSPPPVGQQIEREIASRTRRIHEEIMVLANTELAGQEWIAAHAPQLEVKRPWPAHVDGPGYLAECKRCLFNKFPKLLKNRSNLPNPAVADYLVDQISIVITLERHLTLFNSVYSRFAAIANDTLGKNTERETKVTLGRIIRAFERLPAILNNDELLDVSFFGLIDSSLIHLDHYVMSDLLGLTAALGQLRYGAFNPTQAQAQAYLFSVGAAPDASPYRDRLKTHRQELATRLVSRCVPADLQDDLTAICYAVVCQLPIPEALHKLYPNYIL